MAISTCLLVARQIPNRSEGSEDSLSKAAPKIVSTTTSPDPHKQRFKHEANWGYGIYLGRAMDREEHLVGCRTAGYVRCRTVRRRPSGEQFDQQLMLALRGTPWDAKG
eukprot:5767640-Amphidinium_carterae.1